MALNGTDMADAIVDALVSAGKLAGLDAGDITALKADMAITYNAMVTYIVANMEIKGVTVNTSALLSAPTPLVPVAGDGGAAVSVQMVGNADNQTLTQNNDGTGRVA